MSITKENLEVLFPDNISVRVDETDINMKIYLLAGAPESAFNALSNIFETVTEAEILKIAKDIFHTEVRLLTKTDWLNFCELSNLTESINIKTVFVASSVNVFQMNQRPSIDFKILVQYDETVSAEQSSQEIDSNDSWWNFNILEKVRETSDYNI